MPLSGVLSLWTRRPSVVIITGLFMMMVIGLVLTRSPGDRLPEGVGSAIAVESRKGLVSDLDRMALGPSEPEVAPSASALETEARLEALIESTRVDQTEVDDRLAELEAKGDAVLQSLDAKYGDLLAQAQAEADAAGRADASTGSTQELDALRQQLEALKARGSEASPSSHEGGQP